MPEFQAQVFVCNQITGDDNHCGDKAGFAVREKFNELLKENDLLCKVMISNTGCTSQHRFCERNQCSITVYGPGSNGGTWYIVTEENVEEIVQKHLLEGNKVDTLVNGNLNVNLK